MLFFMCNQRNRINVEGYGVEDSLIKYPCHSEEHSILNIRHMGNNVLTQHALIIIS